MKTENGLLPNSRRPLFFVHLVILSSCFCLSQIASAFMVSRVTFNTSHGPVTLIGLPIHQDITQEALESPFSVPLSSGAAITFTDAAINILRDEVRNADSLYFSSPIVHVDSETIIGANHYLAGRVNHILSQAQSPASTDEPIRTLGTTLHTVQDFYSHTTWIENGRAGTAGLGDVGFDFGMAPSPIAAFVDYCEETGLIGRLDYLTSEYATGTTSSSRSYEYPPNRLKCAHGPGFLPNDAFTVPLPPSLPIPVPRGRGINKDSPARDNFQAAKDRAVLATREFVTKIASQLPNTTQGDRARCALLGHDSFESPPSPCAFGGLVVAPSDSSGYRFDIYTAPAGPGSTPKTVRVSVRWDDDWYLSPVNERTSSGPFLLEVPFSGGSGCNHVWKHPGNNMINLTLDAGDQGAMRTASMTVAPGKTVSIAGSDCFFPDNFRGHQIVIWTVD